MGLITGLEVAVNVVEDSADIFRVEKGVIKIWRLYSEVKEKIESLDFFYLSKDLGILFESVRYEHLGLGMSFSNVSKKMDLLTSRWLDS